MPKYSSHLLLSQLQNQTSQFLDLAISEWQMLPHTTFARKPSPESWSANECLQHLNSYGDFYLPAIKNAILTTENHTPANVVFSPGFFGNMFTKMMMPATEAKPLKKMKAPKPHAPTAILPSHEVIATFIDQQEQMLQWLEKAKSLDLGSIRVPISISRFIKIKLGDTFHFLVMHNLRHVIQAQKALGHGSEVANLAMDTQQAMIA